MPLPMGTSAEHFAGPGISFMDADGGQEGTKRRNSCYNPNSSNGGFPDAKKTLGFRNHSLALGSTVRHFQTLNEFPKPPKQGRKLNVGAMMATLKQDPRAMDIFLDELAIADQVQPKHMKFLGNLPTTTRNGMLDERAHGTQSSFAPGPYHAAGRPDAGALGATARTLGSPLGSLAPYAASGLQSPLLHTGYNLGLQRGTFATQFDSRDYFEKHIRPQNRQLFGAEAQEGRSARNKATFIVHEKGKKEEFQDAVRRHMRALDEADGTVAASGGPELPALQEAGASGRPGFPQLDIAAGLQEIAGERRATLRRAGPREIPHYMRPNAAWIGKAAEDPGTALTRLQSRLLER